MAEPTRDTRPKTSKAEADKKQPETVLLTAEELKAISGGNTGGSGNPSPNPKITTTTTG
ncbi:MAG: hypothetical protein ACYC61_11375 [Isosphaeraceae bacterium]